MGGKRGKGRNEDKRSSSDGWGPALGAPPGRQNQPQSAQQAHQSAQSTAWGPPRAEPSAPSGAPRGRQDQPSSQAPHAAPPAAWGPPRAEQSAPSGEARGRQGQSHSQPSQSAPPAAWGPPRAEQSAPSGQARGRQGQSQSQSPQSAPPTAWGPPRAEQSAPSGEARGRQAQPQSQPPQSAPPTAWGPTRAEQSAPSGGHRSGQRPPQASPSRSVQPSSSSSGSSKRSLDNAPTSQHSKFHADSSRGESVRGALHGDRKRAFETIVHSRQPHLVSKQGAEGKAISLVTNYFRTQGPKWIINTYRVDFRPEVEDRMTKRRLIRDHRELFNGYLFDGTRIFAANRLDIPNNSLELISKLHEGEEVVIVLKFTGELAMTDSSSLQVLNLIMRRAMSGLNLQLVGRNHYDAAAKIEIPQHHIQLWPGYMTSIRQHERNILMCVEIGTKLMRSETVLHILGRIFQNSRSFTADVQKAILGATVLTRYNNRTYRIDDIDFNKNPTATFETKTGPTSFVEYYEKKYKLTIRDLKQPLLISLVKERDSTGIKIEKKVVLIPELCCATGFTDEMRQNNRLMSDVAQHTRIGPPGRIERLINFNRRLRDEPKCMTTFGEWNMQLDPNLVEVPGRVLPNETILFNNRTAATDGRADWTNELRNTKIWQAPKSRLANWCIITTARNQTDTQSFLRSLLTVSRTMGFDIDSNPMFRVINDDRAATYTQELERCAHSNPQFILCVVSNDQAERYSAIKKKCCVDRPIPTQCIKAWTLKKPGLSVATKVALQIVCKLGGAPWSIKMPLNKVMVIGYDVCHDTRDKSKSFGAMVATMDMARHSQYFSTVTAHTNGEELSNELGLNIVKALHEYRRVEGELPDRILIYRDGVGEGQTQYVYEHEVENIRGQLKKIYESDAQKKPVKLGFIIVSKRINTRIFEQGRQVRNPPPGTVVDDVITLPERYDFFLISQHVNQGSASPTSYNVFDYSFGLPPGKLQLLTYKMCHLYYNWTGTTRVPAVCQYAHKLAFLAGQYLHQAPSPTLEKSLFFL